MVNKELLDYIKQQIGNNISKDQIKNSLLNNGWDSSDVQEGFTAVEPHPSMVPPPSPSSPYIIPNMQSSSNTINPIISSGMQPMAGFVNPAVNQQPVVVQNKSKTWLKVFFVIIGCYFSWCGLVCV